MQGNIGSNISIHQVAAVIGDESITPYNAFGSGMYNDLATVLSSPSGDLVNNVRDAVNGMSGIVSDGDPQTIAYQALTCGLQIAAAKHAEHEKKASEKAQAKQDQSEEKQPAHHNSNEAVAKNKNTSLVSSTSDTIAELGKALGSFIKSEFTISTPTAKLFTFGPAAQPFAGMAPNHIALAA